MIDVRMREDHGMDLFHRQWQLRVLVPRIGPMPLEHAAIQQDGASAYTENVAGTGDLTGRTEEFDFHPCEASGSAARARARSEVNAPLC